MLDLAKFTEQHWPIVRFLGSFSEKKKKFTFEATRSREGSRGDIMFFQLAVHGISRGDLGWILSKHPDNTFSREVKKGRSVEASWGPLLPLQREADEEGKKGNKNGEEGGEVTTTTYYSYRGKNDPASFMEIMKFNNSPSYVHAALSAICPYTLVCFREVNYGPPPSFISLKKKNSQVSYLNYNN